MDWPLGKGRSIPKRNLLHLWTTIKILGLFTALFIAFIYNILLTFLHWLLLCIQISTKLHSSIWKHLSQLKLFLNCFKILSHFNIFTNWCATNLSPEGILIRHQLSHSEPFNKQLTHFQLCSYKIFYIANWIIICASES